jgi:hypothetical protein
MVYSVKMKWQSTEVHVATGFATRAEAWWAISMWLQSFRCFMDPFYIVEEPSGDPAEQADANPSDLDDDDDVCKLFV